MKQTKKNAFILDNCNSPYIAQAIFILKEDVSQNGEGVLAEAERIVASYMGNALGYKKRPKKKNYLNYFLFGAVLACVVSVILFLLF